MHYDIIFLSMSCNKPLYRAEVVAIRDTWASSLVRGDISGCTWFSYTACDRDHPHPCIDVETHTIYCKCEDDLPNTIIKTQQAFKILEQSDITFDYIVRTNTSTYLCVDQFITAYKSHKLDNRLTGLFVTNLPVAGGDVSCVIVSGACMVLSKEMVDIIKTENVTNNNINDYSINNILTVVDDFIMSAIIFKEMPKFNPNICTDLCVSIPMSRFKTNNNVKGRFIYENQNQTNDAQKALDHNMIVRLVMAGVTDEERFKEISHMYELHDAYKQYYRNMK